MSKAQEQEIRLLQRAGVASPQPAPRLGGSMRDAPPKGCQTETVEAHAPDMPVVEPAAAEAKEKENEAAKDAKGEEVLQHEAAIARPAQGIAQNGKLCSSGSPQYADQRPPQMRNEPSLDQPRAQPQSSSPQTPETLQKQLRPKAKHTAATLRSQEQRRSSNAFLAVVSCTPLIVYGAWLMMSNWEETNNALTTIWEDVRRTVQSLLDPTIREL